MSGRSRSSIIAPALKQMELDADCCAVQMLRSKHETDGIEAAREAMIGFGRRRPAPITRPETSGPTTSPNARRKTERHPGSTALAPGGGKAF